MANPCTLSPLIQCVCNLSVLNVYLVYVHNRNDKYTCTLGLIHVHVD